ncbi:hypothetical protein [Thermoplasma sp.]|uniref:hypothetical protein n=1 Tax=Thermoplasma sp. TaxID=1973142 RepID=UPI0025DD8D94|nr:hypothetical protein [Thermoplasma sp.]
MIRNPWFDIGTKKYVKNFDITRAKDPRLIRKFIVIRNLIMIFNVAVAALILVLVWS